ncbi:unnamed protein product [Hymenolepis diminuta]|uniref:DUF5727 domain-containing protein n=1 Tax=Hymenolepis diminuta TaxID=6216 RepID=A0A564Y1Y4_HYMDI|nr:unnamed protein product [Hymenolepis diminuta]
MYFKSADDLLVRFEITSSSLPEPVYINNGNCIVKGKIIGSLCEVQRDRTVITFDKVPDSGRLVLSYSNGMNAVYFAKDCKFPTRKDGEIIVEKSIPLYRFLGGKTEEKVVFAMKGTNYNGIFLYRENSSICEWNTSIPATGVCANLTVDEVNGLISFNATFSKTDDKNYETLFWGRRYNAFAVNLDWTHTGEAPEVEACGTSDD